jgi:hypothetical protein
VRTPAGARGGPRHAFTHFGEAQRQILRTH